jgi:hypothetical protein
MTACAWTPRVIEYPDGSRIIQVDQFTLDKICSRTSDSGLPLKHAVACYDRKNRITYVRYDCDGAKALTHERAHEQGVKNPSLEGYDW